MNRAARSQAITKAESTKLATIHIPTGIKVLKMDEHHCSPVVLENVGDVLGLGWLIRERRRETRNSRNVLPWAIRQETNSEPSWRKNATYIFSVASMKLSENVLLGFEESFTWI